MKDTELQYNKDHMTIEGGVVVVGGMRAQTLS